MVIRKITENDLDIVSSICIESFTNSVAASLSERGIFAFKELSSPDSFLSRMKDDNVILVSEDQDNLNGIIELKEGRHVAMLFVDTQHQNKGVGKRLLSEALVYARVSVVTVSASLSSVPAYIRYGFECKGDVAESSGLTGPPSKK